MLQILLLNALYPLALVSTEKDVLKLCEFVRFLYSGHVDLPNMVMTTKTKGKH